MGKQTLLNQLTEVLNINNILSTNVVCQILIQLNQLESSNLDPTDGIEGYKKLCQHVRNGCNFDLSKCYVDGKPLIISGAHVDPSLFLEDERSLKTATDLEI